MDKDDNHSMECHPYSLYVDDDVFTIAFNVLEQVARENGFAIHIMYLMMVIACLAA